MRRLTPLGWLIASVCLALAGCASPLARDVPLQPALLPTRTSAPRSQATPAQTTPTPRAPQATRYPACEAARPDIRPVSSAAPAGEGQIVFITPEGNIALTDPSGRRRTPITADAFINEQQEAGRIYRFPTFSPDGRFLAFTSLSTVGGTNAITSSVYVAPATPDADILTLYSTTEWNIPYLDWSPDNALIAFLTVSPAAGAIRVIAREGGEAVVFDTGIPTYWPTYWHWRPDSAGMVTHLGGRATTKGKASVSLIASRGTVKDRQTVIEELPGAFQSPQWSPDGRYVLLVAYTDGQDELVLADAAGKPICTIQIVAYNAYFAWSPDGRSVAVLDTTPSPQGILLPAELIIYDLVDGNSRAIHDEASLFFWSPDSRKLMVYSLAFGAGSRPLGMGSNRLSAPAAQQPAAGLRIEIVDRAAGRRVKVADVSPTGAFSQYFPYFDQYSRALTPWSPDSRRLVFAGALAGEDAAEVAVAALSPEEDAVSITRIAQGIVAFWSPR